MGRVNSPIPSRRRVAPAASAAAAIARVEIGASPAPGGVGRGDTTTTRAESALALDPTSRRIGACARPVASDAPSKACAHYRDCAARRDIHITGDAERHNPAGAPVPRVDGERPACRYGDSGVLRHTKHLAAPSRIRILERCDR